MAKSKIWNIIDGYEGEGAERRLASTAYSGSTTTRRRRTGTVARLSVRLRRALIYASSKAYGAATLAFGLLTVILSFLRRYTDFPGDSSAVTLGVGAALALLSIPLLLCDKPMAFVFQDNPLTDYLFFELFCMKRVSRTEAPRSVYTVTASVTGVLLALVGYFVPVWLVVAVVVGLAIAALALSSPEFSFFLSILVLPYAETTAAAEIIFHCIVAITFVSMVVKIASGKRVIHFTRYDTLLVLMLITVIMSGVFVKGIESFGGAVSMVVMTFGYTVSSCLVSNRRIADSALGTLVISSVPVSIWSITEFALSLFDGSYSSLVGEGITVAFADGGTYAVFLMAAICSAAALIKQSHGLVRSLCLCAVFLQLAALTLTGELLALLALLVGLLVYSVIKTGYLSLLIFPLLLLLPYTLLLLPDSAVNAVFSVIPSLSDVSSLRAFWRAMLEVLGDNILIGIGIGQQSFAEEMAAQGLSAEGSAHNLLLELAMEAGVICAVLFVLIIMARLRHQAAYYPFVKGSEVAKLAPIMGVALFAMLFYGATSYIFGSGVSYYLFWVIFGIGGALLRIAGREHDDRVNYYEDNSASDASDLDLLLSSYGQKREK
jgi:hypothetical protein